MAFRRQHIRNIRTAIEAGTPLDGEYPWDQTLKTIRAGDGTTLGGHLMGKWGRSYTVSPAQITANQNDYNPTDLAIAETLELDLSANWMITGLALGVVNRSIWIYNKSAFRLTLADENAGSSAANRFSLGGSNVVLRPGQGGHLVWFASLSRWRLVGRSDLGVTDLPEGVTFSGECRPNQVTANQNDWDPVDATSTLAWSASRASSIYVSTDASRNFTGLAGGAKGRIAIIENNGANPVVLKNADPGSAAANRFDIGADITLGAKQRAFMQWDATASRWKMIANTAGAGVADGAVISSKLDHTAAGGNIINGTLVWSVAGSALTIAVKTFAGNDPSPADPVWVRLRDLAANTDASDLVKLTAALSVVISNGSSLGVPGSNTAFRIWAVLFNDAGTPRIGVLNCLSAANIYPLTVWGIASSTAEGGAGAADNAQTFYTGTAVASKPYAVLGYATWETGLASAGVWGAGPTRVQMFGAGVPLPGARVQTARSVTGSLNTGTTILPFDDTIPQNTEGDQWLSQAITPASAANLLRISSQVSAAFNVGGTIMGAALFQDSGANAIAATTTTSPSANYMYPLNIVHYMLAALTTATTFKIRAGGHQAGTFSLNGSNAGRIFGGVLFSWLEIEEIMA